MSWNPGAEPGSTSDADAGQGPGAGAPGGPYQAPLPGQDPGPPPEPYPAVPPPKSRRNEFIRLGILLAIAVVIGGGFILLRDRLSNEVASLQPGECFDRPAAGASVVTDVQRQPCNEPHDAEVFANVTHTAAPGASYPPSTEFSDLAGDECVPIIQSYTGLTIDQIIARNLDFGFFYPTDDGWGGGDRSVTCYATSADDSKLTGSIRNAGAASPSP